MKKIALVHDNLCTLGGAERVFQYICQEFEEADIYTTTYNPSKTHPYYQTRKINTTWLNTFIQSHEKFRWSFPLATYAMQGLDLTDYDVVLSSSGSVAKYILSNKGKHINYCYLPTRAIWQSDQYFVNSVRGKIFKTVLPYLRKRDYLAAQKIDYFVAISNTTKNYIKQYYDREAAVIYCPIETEKFCPGKTKKNHYLLVSRLERSKRVDYAIEAFNRLGLPLKIVGTGNEKSNLQAIAKSNIEFLGAVEDATLASEYSEALAVIFTPFLEYGLIPLEANASGTPVISYGYGGITETMIPTDNINSLEPPTAVFYYEQTADALVNAIKKFEKVNFESTDLVKHASKWNVETFKKKIREYIMNVD